MTRCAAQCSASGLDHPWTAHAVTSHAQVAPTPPPLCLCRSNAPKTPQEVQAQRAQLALMEQDCARLVNPDYLRPFASLEDAVDRLLPYHVRAFPCQPCSRPHRSYLTGGQGWRLRVLKLESSGAASRSSHVLPLLP